MWSSDFLPSPRRPAIAATLLLLPGIVLADPGDFVIGAGVETDSEEGLAFALLGDVAMTDDTWLSGSVSYSGVDGVRPQQEVDYLYADIAVDHFFDPVGLRVGVSYWGDPDALDSFDLRGSIYSRGDAGSLSIDGEYRDFDINFPVLDTLPRATIGFDATGIGLSGRVNAGEDVTLRAAGMNYEYSRDFDITDSARVIDLLTFSRLSVLTSLVEWRVSAGISIDVGLRQWQLDLTRWSGIVDNSDNVGATISFLTPLSRRTDLELALGYDDSNLYGDVTFLSAYLYFYGGN
ncbi:MAG: hypothetical protein R3288_05780 [Woeseiaceae bacterium]|nr:hypothetical protein [Woeseiaceae bacterium]